MACCRIRTGRETTAAHAHEVTVGAEHAVPWPPAALVHADPGAHA